MPMKERHLISIKESALAKLGSMNMLKTSLEVDLHADILPWLKAQEAGFKKDSVDCVSLAEEIIT